MIDFCPECNQDKELRLVKETVIINIRGEEIPVMEEYYQCVSCGEKYERPRKDVDPLADAYREYRRRKGYLQPEEIVQIRKQFGLTQKQMSDLVGIGIATLNRYENGALQSEAHDQVIRLTMQPDNLRRRLQSHPEILPLAASQRIISRTKECGDLFQYAVDQLGSYPPSLESGYVRFDICKVTQTIKYFCFDNGVVKTLLMKLLFYADFLHFKENGVSITGLRYAHLPYGPVPDQFETWLTALSDWKPELSKQERLFGDYPGEVYIAQDVDLSCFSESEHDVLIRVKQKLGHISARQISELSHQEKAYQATRNSEIISYHYAADLQI